MGHAPSPHLAMPVLLILAARHGSKVPASNVLKIGFSMLKTFAFLFQINANLQITPEIV